MLDESKWRTLIGRFQRDERGAVAIYLGLSATVLVGSLGLAAETGWLYWQQRQLQHAADVASFAVGTDKFNRKDTSTVTTQKEAALNVSSASVVGELTIDDVTINNPPSSGPYPTSDNPWAIEVVLQREVPRLFSSVFSTSPYTLVGRSTVASWTDGSGDACVLALNTTAKGAVTVGGSGDVNADGCIVASNSKATESVDFQGAKAKLHADCVRASGTVDFGTSKSVEATQLTTDCEATTQNADPLPDPYADRTPPTIPSTCDGTSSSGAILRCGNYTPRNNVSGVQIIRDKLVINEGDNLTSGTNGVTFYLEKGAQVIINGKAIIDFSAPLDGPTKGLLFWAAKDYGDEIKLNGTADTEFNGAIYNPSGTVNWLGDSANIGCPQIIADKVKFTGDNYTKIDCVDAETGTSPTNPPVKFNIVR